MQRRPRRSREPSQLGGAWVARGPLRNAFPPLAPLSQGQIEAIHDASLRLLEEIGIEFQGAAACEVLRKAGAVVEVKSGLTRIPREVVLAALKTAPDSFTLTPRNPARAVHVGGDHVSFGLVAGPPNVHDAVNGRRAGNYADYANLIRLAQSFDIIHFIGNQPTAPQELPARTRHLDCYLANIRYSDRVYHCTAIGRERALDGIDMMALSRGLTRERMAASPGVLTIISVNSPRRFDAAMSDGLMAMAEHGQAVVVTPFTLMGAMAPVSLAAALTQQNAEALAGITLAQLTRPGAPVVYGAFTSDVDMKSGAPAFGTPEYTKAALAGGQLARRLNVPYRSSNVTASNIVDVQAAYESMMSLWGAIMGGVNLIEHAAGWMEGGLTASFEKLILDAELLQGMREFLKPIAVDEAEMALGAIAEVGPGGHFFGVGHTLERFEHAFYEPMLSDWRNYQTWQNAGGKTGTERANTIWKELLRSYEAPPMDAGRREALAAYVARRKEAIKAGKLLPDPVE